MASCNMTAVMNGNAKTHDSQEFIIQHEGDTYDIARFLPFHPGGRNSVSPYQGLSITKKFRDINHSPAAMYLMRDYRLPATSQTSTVEDLEVQKSHSPLIGSIFSLISIFLNNKSMFMRSHCSVCVCVCAPQTMFEHLTWSLETWYRSQIMAPSQIVALMTLKLLECLN
jgi:cytochrome b involved in lipid metabolism